MNRRLIVILIFLLWQLALPAQKFSGNTGFIENKGQIIDQNWQSNNRVKFLFTSPGFNVQLREDGFSYDIYERLDSSQQSFHRIDFHFEDLNPSFLIEKVDPSISYSNYYTFGTPTEGIINVHCFAKIIYKDFYPNIDLIFENTDKNKFKYSFKINPGGKLQDIRFTISGSSPEISKDGSILLKTQFGEINEVIPLSYSISGNKKNYKTIRFSSTQNVFSLSCVEKICKTDRLIIDPIPERIWGTYVGGNSFEDNPSVKVDELGNVYSYGFSSSTNNIATSGAFQGILSGGEDCYLTKFSPNGNKIWGTYYGGQYDELTFDFSLTYDAAIVITGKTNSPTNIATPGAFQPTISGILSGDAFLAKFDTAGFRLWGTYYGGTGSDIGYSCFCDVNNNIIITGNTTSLSGMSTSGAYQETYGGGGDIFIGVFDINGNRIWGSYFGGNGVEFSGIWGGCYSNGTSIYFCGSTTSLVNIASPGSWQTTLSGPEDGFIAKFNINGSRIWSTYFGGNNVDRFLTLTASPSRIYLSGFTLSSDFPVTTSSYQTVYGGSQDAILTEFSPDGNLFYSSFFGNDMGESFSNIKIDSIKNIYLAGGTGSTGLATPGSYQSVFGGGPGDGIFAKFDSLHSLIWASYYGGEGHDAISTICLLNHYLFISGQTTSYTGIASSGSSQSNFGGGSQDNFLVKFYECEKPFIPTSIMGPGTLCLNSLGNSFSVNLISNATNYLWHLPFGFTITSGLNNSSILADVGPLATSGYISVRGVNDCGEGDSSYLYVLVKPLPVPAITGNSLTCNNTIETYSTDSGKSNYQWNISSGGQIISGGLSADNQIQIKWINPGAQWVEVNYTDTNNCDALIATHYTVTVNPGDSINVSIVASINNICSGTSVTFSANPTGTGTLTYDWKVNGSSQGVNNPTFNYTPSNGDVVTCVLSSSITTCVTNNPATSNAITMVVNPPVPVAVNISASQNPVCVGSSVTFTASQTVPGNLSYQWFVNANPVGNNSSTYTYTPSNNDAVHCSLLTDHQCSTNNPASSNTITMNVTANIVVAVSISASSNPICGLLPVTFTATQAVPGNLTYSWFVNGNPVGTNSSNYTYTPNNNDAVHCSLLTDHQCSTNNPANSNNIIMSIIPAPVVTYTICTDSITTTNARPIKLKGGIPLGGTYSGPGVNSLTGVFSPAIAGPGIKAITYSYTNAGMCSANKTKNIIVQAPAAFTCGGLFTDIRDNKMYQTIQTGSMCWFAEDLNYGTSIPQTTHQRDNCVVEKYQSAVGSQQSAVYQWDEMMAFNQTAGEQGICPPSWHVPTETEWQILFNNYGGIAFSGSPLKYSGFSGFNAMLNGFVPHNTTLLLYHFATFYWTSTAYGPYKAWAHGMNEPDPSVSSYPAARQDAFGVRCVKD